MAQPVISQPIISQPVILRRAESSPIRKVEDSMFEIDNRRRYEGTLVKLTATSTDYDTDSLATHTYVTTTEQMNQVR